MTIIERALDLVTNDSRVGLGSGHAAQAFVRALGERVRRGRLRVHGVPTSEETVSLSRKEGIPLLSLAEAEILDITVDGADEGDPQLNLIKGYGRDMVREKIVAASSRRLVVLVGDEKIVPQLGTRGKLPVEVVPFALPLCKTALISVKGTGLKRTLSNPAFMAKDLCPWSAWPVMATICVCAKAGTWRNRITRRQPSMSGIAKSINIRSGRNTVATSSADVPP